MAFAGLTADARVLIKQARVECQSHKLTVEDPVTLGRLGGFLVLVIMPPPCRIHHQTRGQPQAEIHTEQWKETIRHLLPYYRYGMDEFEIIEYIFQRSRL